MKRIKKHSQHRSSSPDLKNENSQRSLKSSKSKKNLLRKNEDESSTNPQTPGRSNLEEQYEILVKERDQLYSISQDLYDKTK